MQAHGTGTPQNRVTESQILSRVALAFGIEAWPVAAIKAYLGHSLGAASGDQVASTLGSWAHGVLPGIVTTTELADDVATAGLNFGLTHRELDPADQRYALINSKGFGGNNATATLLSPLQTQEMLAARHGNAAGRRWRACGRRSRCGARKPRGARGARARRE